MEGGKGPLCPRPTHWCVVHCGRLGLREAWLLEELHKDRESGCEAKGQGSVMMMMPTSNSSRTLRGEVRVGLHSLGLSLAA